MIRRVLVGAIVGALLVAACAGDDTAPRAGGTTTTLPTTTVPAAPPAPAAPSAVLLGDSNTAFSQADVEAQVRAAGVEPTVRALPGYGVKDVEFWLGELPALLADDPDVVVVALGTNDALEAENAAVLGDRLDELMTALGDRRVVWLTHHEGRPEPEGTNARTVNAAIREAPARWDNLTVLDLAPLLAADPSLLDVDAVHFSETGRPWFAQQLAAAASAAVRGS